MKKIIHIIFILSIFTLSCQVEKVESNLQSFFDLNDFLEEEIISMSNLKSIKKKVSINSKVDEQILNDFDLKNDLEIFRNANINKVAWLDKYDVDSTFNQKGLLQQLKYKALGNKLKTREFIINYKNEKVNSISIKKETSNQVSLLNQHLQYFPSKGYTIESNQKVTMTDPQLLKIEVEYLKGN